MSAELTAHALGGRKSGHGRAVRCPAHDDHTPSFAISHADDRKVLVLCHAGCDQDKVINRLPARGLWPEQRSHWPWSLPRDLGVLGRDVLRLALSTLAKLRPTGNGRPYCKLGSRVVKRREELEAWFESHVARNATDPEADVRLPKRPWGL